MSDKYRGEKGRKRGLEFLPRVAFAGGSFLHLGVSSLWGTWAGESERCSMGREEVKSKAG